MNILESETNDRIQKFENEGESFNGNKSTHDLIGTIIYFRRSGTVLIQAITPAIFRPLVVAERLPYIAKHALLSGAAQARLFIQPAVTHDLSCRAESLRASPGMYKGVQFPVFQ